jgi:hypothetical protein
MIVCSAQTYPGTVHGALLSGERAAAEVEEELKVLGYSPATTNTTNTTAPRNSATAMGASALLAAAALAAVLVL